MPHEEQCDTSFVKSTSQPFARESSQSAKPALHVIWQTLFAQYGVPLIAPHAVPQPPQLPASAEVLVSQPLLGSPSQSAYGAVHLSITHFPAEHADDACASEHAVAQSPQCIASVCRFASQSFVMSPSQSPLPSRQVSAHEWFVQLLLEQSVSTLQACPGAHFGQREPPQSFSVSSPLRTPSEQVGCEQEPLSQTLLSQSVFCTQPAPGVHGAQLPPQSTLVSFSSCVPSVQCASGATWPPSPPSVVTASSRKPKFGTVHEPSASAISKHQQPANSIRSATTRLETACRVRRWAMMTAVSRGP